MSDSTIRSTGKSGAGGTPVADSPEALEEVESVQIGRRHYSVRTYLVLLTTCIFLAWMLSSFDTTMVGVAGPPLAAAFHISASSMLYVLTLLGVASMIAAFAIGLLIDRLGRKRMFQMVLLGVGLFSGLVAVIGVLWQFVIIRVFANFSSAGIQPAANTLIAEEAPPKLRGRLQGLSVAGYALGGAIAGTVAAAILAHFSWRILFLFAFLPVLVVFFATRYLRESPRYLEKQAESAVPEEVSGRSPVKRLLAPGLRGQTVTIMVFGFFSGGLTLFVSEALPLYLTSLRHMSAPAEAAVVSFNFFALIIGDLLAAALTDYISSKWILFGFPVISAVLLIPFTIPSTGYWGLVLAMLASGVFGQSSFAAWLVHVPATYPTELRGSGTGFGLGGTFAGTIVVPLMAAPLLGIQNVSLIPILMLGVTVAMAVTALFLRYVPPRKDVDTSAREIVSEMS
jgi:putative MFS transporter